MVFKTHWKKLLLCTLPVFHIGKLFRHIFIFWGPDNFWIHIFWNFCQPSVSPCCFYKLFNFNGNPDFILWEMFCRFSINPFNSGIISLCRIWRRRPACTAASFVPHRWGSWQSEHMNPKQQNPIEKNFTDIPSTTPKRKRSCTFRNNFKHNNGWCWCQRRSFGLRGGGDNWAGNTRLVRNRFTTKISLDWRS